jgi:hypothetical protein
MHGISKSHTHVVTFFQFIVNITNETAITADGGDVSVIDLNTVLNVTFVNSNVS